MTTTIEILMRAAVCDSCGGEGPLGRDDIAARSEARASGWRVDDTTHCPDCRRSHDAARAARLFPQVTGGVA